MTRDWALVWRYVIPWLFAAAIAANLFGLATLTIQPWNGDTGMTLVSTGLPFESRATEVSQPALGAGFRPGDVFDARDLYRANGFAKPVAGVRYALVGHRGKQTIAAHVVPLRGALTWDASVRFIVVLWVLLFAFVIARRAERTNSNALLLLVLLLIAFESPFSSAAFPDSRLVLLYALFNGAGFCASCAMLAVYGVQFGRPLSLLRRVLFGFALASCALAFVALLALQSTIAYPWADANAPAPQVLRFWAPMMLLFVTISLVSAVVAARIDERQRVAWVLASFVPFFVGVAAGNVAFDNPTWFALQRASLLFVPAGLTYAAVTRRMFDFGFVVNRAAVFTVVSAIVIGAFVILEWALGKWFENVSHATNLALNVGLALVVGISIRFIHRHVDRTVDVVLFRKRHDDERAIRAFALEAPYITDQPLLLRRTVEVVERHADCTFVRLMLEDQAGRYDGVSENDPAILRLRATHEALDLHTVQSSVTGDLAYPMVARGRLVGVLVLGPRSTGELYAPDESAAIAQLALSVGAALDVHANKQGDAVVTTLSRIELSIDRLGNELTGLLHLLKDKPGKTSLPE